jgi:oxygen-independent coproporphyrinogen III oxidase
LTGRPAAPTNPAIPRSAFGIPHLVRFPPVHHLYLHVPFCARRCSYCDFSIAVRRRIPAAEYIGAIRSEFAEQGEIGPLETVYLGGGTPSLLPSHAVASLLQYIFDQAPSANAVEVTLEANPEDVTPDAVRVWRAAGVSRVSLGAQSFDERVLRWMHRSHDAGHVTAAVETLRRGGIDNISLDLIFALPPELERDWRGDLDRALALEPAHLSLYGLTVEPRTPLARWVSRGATAPPDDERYAEEYLLAHERLAEAGYVFYEVSNAAREGRRSRHNSAYWSGRPYLGLGPAAHSFDGRTRRWNLAPWEAYRRALADGGSPVESEETLTDEQGELEQLYLGLRTVEGLSSTILHRPPQPPQPVSLLLARGWMVQDRGRLRCTPEGWLRLDTLVHALTGSGAIS